MKTSIEEITPENAKAYLGTSVEHQRNLRKSWVNTLCNHIKNGTFHTTHQGIAFNSEGRLFDGQHRLAAIVKAGISVKMMVIRGVHNDAWHATDIGIKRTAADITGIPRLTAEAIRTAIDICRTQVFQQSAEEMLRIYATPFGAALDRIKSAVPTAARYFSSSPVRVSCALWMVRSGDNYPLEQYRALVHQDYDSMSQSVKSMNRQVCGGGLTAKTWELAIRSFRAFDPENRDNGRLVIKDKIVVMEALRKALIQIIGG